MPKDHDPGYTPEEMDRYFSDPVNRRQKSTVMSTRKAKNRIRAYLIIGAAILLLLGGYGWYLASGLPSLEKIENPKPELATKVYSIDGEVLDQFYIKNRSHVSINQIPKTVIDALIATEDRNFYSH
jgi:penicillin-binding protein 1A